MLLRSISLTLAAVGAVFGAPAAPPAACSLDLGGGVHLELVLIPAGSSDLGADENTGDGDEWPIHRVAFSHAFYLGRYEVTQEQWQRIMGSNPSHFPGARRPVECVSWNDCRQFVLRLSTQTKRRFALPTEAQWEYACRAGAKTVWSFGDAEARLAQYAWYAPNSGGETHPVGQKRPNAWGLYDMNGNVGEWCADWYVKHAYPDRPVTDPAPIQPATDRAPVMRGGAWGDESSFTRSSARNCSGADNRQAGIGLRVAMEVEP